MILVLLRIMALGVVLVVALFALIAAYVKFLQRRRERLYPSHHVPVEREADP